MNLAAVFTFTFKKDNAMKTRFFLILLTLVILFSAWLYLNYSIGSKEKDKLEKMANLPIYAYIADTTKVTPILTELKTVPGIKNVVHETALQAATELIQAYGLPLNEEMIKDYAIPDVITINLQPNRISISNKPVIMDILRSYIPETDIDSQSNAYSLIIQELMQLDLYNIVFNVFTAVLMLLIFVFSRTTLELNTLLHYKRYKYSAVENIRHQRQGLQHTLLMLIVPLPLCLLAYFAYVYFKPLHQVIPYWVFLAQAGTVISGTMINYFILHSFEQQVALQENPVEVITPEEMDTVENKEQNNDTPFT